MWRRRRTTSLPDVYGKSRNDRLDADRPAFLKQGPPSPTHLASYLQQFVLSTHTGITRLDLGMNTDMDNQR